MNKKIIYVAIKNKKKSCKKIILKNFFEIFLICTLFRLNRLNYVFFLYCPLNPLVLKNSQRKYFSLFTL